jgi:hypothetical protein
VHNHACTPEVLSLKVEEVAAHTKFANLAALDNPEHIAETWFHFDMLNEPAGGLNEKLLCRKELHAFAALGRRGDTRLGTRDIVSGDPAIDRMVPALQDGRKRMGCWEDQSIESDQ